jgi:hypothetical protein
MWTVHVASGSSGLEVQSHFYITSMLLLTYLPFFYIILVNNDPDHALACFAAAHRQEQVVPHTCTDSCNLTLAVHAITLLILGSVQFSKGRQCSLGRAASNC